MTQFLSKKRSKNPFILRGPFFYGAHFRKLDNSLLKFSLLFLTFSICLKTPIFSQISPTLFLATAKTKPIILRQEAFINTLKSTPYKLPLVEKITAQTETDRYELQRQQYQTRVSFNSWAEMKQEKRWKQANINVEETNKNVLFQDILLDRYTVLVEYRSAINALDIYKKIYLVFTDKRDVLQKMAKLSTNFNIEDLIKAEENAYQFQLKIAEKEALINKINQYGQFIFGSKDAFNLDTSNWIPLSIMRNFVVNLPKSVSNNALLSQQEAKINLSQTNYNIEKASTKKVIDYAQLKYGARQTKDLQTDLSIGLGFVVPYRGSSKTILNKLTFKQLEEKNRLDNIHESLDLQLFTTQQDLDITLKEYDLVTKQINESQTLYSLDHYAQIQGGSPIVLLRMQELVLQRQARLVELEHDAFSKYLKLLDATGKLSALPLQNYLSANFEAF
jgi:hypothetical protein